MLNILQNQPSPFSLHTRVRHNGMDEKTEQDISEEEARNRVMNVLLSDKRPYVGATYNTEKRTLYIHSDLDETLFQHDKNMGEKGNSVFPKCIFMFRKLS
uniref:Uncharacterized protein n=1 Tax=viral metagenome TaxID=1070528 RepID=A0A6C0FC42_9ZZZZ